MRNVLLTRLWLNWIQWPKTGARIMKEVLKSPRYSSGRSQFRSNLYMAESTSGQGQYLIHINITMGVALGSWDYFCEVGGWPLTSSWGTKDSVTHTKEDIQSFKTQPSHSHCMMGEFRIHSIYFTIGFLNKQKLVFMKQNDLPVPKSSFSENQGQDTFQENNKRTQHWDHHGSSRMSDKILFCSLCSLSPLLFF